jgi:hypothetical protein
MLSSTEAAVRAGTKVGPALQAGPYLIGQLFQRLRSAKTWGINHLKNNIDILLRLIPLFPHHLLSLFTPHFKTNLERLRRITKSVGSRGRINITSTLARSTTS